MNIKYLGTAAAEGIPALFCDCENCRKARAAGGRNIRTRSQALIDGRLLIDFPADTYLHFLQHDVPLSKIENCLITHSHSDHLYPEDLYMRLKGLSHLENQVPLTIYSDESGYEMVSNLKTAKNLKDDEILVKRVYPFVPFEVDGYTVTALRAAHDKKSSPVVYIIEKDKKSIFYSNDTSEYPEETMAYLKECGKTLDLISLDCTEADGNATYVGHLTLTRCAALKKALLEMGVAKENTRFILNHFSHNGVNVLYDDFVKLAAKEGFEVTYDGMTVEI